GPRAPYLSYALFDVEAAPDAQNIPCDHFDVVVATNVLHATRNIRRTLGNITSCLKPGGILLLNEMAAKRLFSHLTFGLLKGWWLSEDLDLRIEGSPIVAQETWMWVLQECGFARVICPTQDVIQLGQQCLIAEKCDERGRKADTRPTPAITIVEPVAKDAVDSPIDEGGGKGEFRREIGRM